MAGKQREFMGRRIANETIALGVGGQLKREDGFPELPPLARVRFTAWADYENLKHKFLDNGKVDEILILTIEAATFEVLEVTERPIQEELLVDQPELVEEPPADATPGEDEVTAKRRGRGRTGKDDA